jgi:hypothetical protein
MCSDNTAIASFDARVLSRGWIIAGITLLVASDLVASVTIPLEIANPGAESGSLVGWENATGNFSAVNDALTAREGTWYFEAPAVPAGSIARMGQVIDVRPYHGLIEYIILEASLAADLGTATVVGPSQAGEYVYTATAMLSFFDIGGNQIPIGVGAFIEGDPDFTWVDRVVNLQGFDYIYPDLFPSIGYIGISLGGVWLNTTTDSFASGAIPDIFHTATPTGVRFDRMQLSIVVPEPATVSLLAISVMFAAIGRTCPRMRLPSGWCATRRAVCCCGRSQSSSSRRVAGWSIAD